MDRNTFNNSYEQPFPKDKAFRIDGGFVYIRNETSGYEQTFFLDAETILGLLHAGEIVHARATMDLTRPTFVLSSEARHRSNSDSTPGKQHSDYFRQLFPARYLQALFTGRRPEGDRYTQFTAAS